VVILNSITNSSNCANNDKDSNNNLKSTSLNSNATIIQSKGQILDISFIQTNGDLFMPINSNINNETTNPKILNTYKSLSNNASSPTNAAAAVDSDLLDMDMEFIATAQYSNSIADNFHKTANANATTDSTSSPLVPSNFVNPFANSVPEDKEIKDFPPAIKDIKEAKESKGLFKSKSKKIKIEIVLFFVLIILIFSRKYIAK